MKRGIYNTTRRLFFSRKERRDRKDYQAYYASAGEAQLTRAEDAEVRPPLNPPAGGRANDRWAESFPISDFTFPFAYLCALLS